MTAVGVSMSLASVFFAYGLAAWVDARSSKALAYAIDDASLWLTPPGGLRLDRRFGAILPTGQIPTAIVNEVRGEPGVRKIRRVAVQAITLNGVPAILFATDGILSNTVTASPEIWTTIQSRPTTVTILGKQTQIADVDPNLPDGCLSGAFDLWAPSSGTGQQVGYLQVYADDPKAIANSLGSKFHATVSDSPGNIGGSVVDGQLMVYLLQGSFSRFDPFSFQTKYSSLILYGTLSTIFGWTARGVFFIGFALSISSALMGVQERRREIALFGALGQQSSLTTLFILEASVMIAFAFIVGALVSTLLLYVLQFLQTPTPIIGAGIVMCAIHAVLLALVTPLIAAQRVASRKAADLVREGRL
jgi:ABC-type antimicrobial peptide transport system permease subunit